MTDLDTLLAELAAAPQRGPFHDNITHYQAAKRYNNRDLALFHAYNPNGLAAEWSALGDRLIAHGRGYLAYGDIGYLSGELRRLASHDRKRVNTIELTVVLRMIRDTIDRGNAFLSNPDA